MAASRLEHQNHMEQLDQIWHDSHANLLGFIRRRVGATDIAEDILAEMLRIEFKTDPVDGAGEKSKVHDHPHN